MRNSTLPRELSRVETWHKLQQKKIESAQRKQGVTNTGRISIRKGEERIQTNTYIQTFNQPRTPEEVKIDSYLERVEQYVPVPLRCFKCQKCGHHREACRGQATCVKCDEKDPDHVEEDCLKEIKCSNCPQHHPAYARSCVVSKKEKEIIKMKPKKKGTFQEARRIVGSYMGESSYTSVAWRADRTNENNKYRSHMEKLIQLEANYLLKFLEPLKKLHPVEFYQAQAQQPVGNRERSNFVVQTKTDVGSTTPTRTTPRSEKSPTKQQLHKSRIRPPKIIKDRQKMYSIRHEQLKQKSQALISQAAKIQMNTKLNKERPRSTFKMPSRTKSPIRTKQCNAQGSKIP